MSPLVESGVLAASDWEMAGVPLASRGAAIDRLRASSRSLVECRVMDARLGLKGAERAILLAFAGPIASLLVEMAIASMSNDAMLAAVAESASRSRRRREGAFYDPGDLLMKSALHADPQAFLDDAQARLDEAKADIARARRRMSYLGVERGGADPKEAPCRCRWPPPPRSPRSPRSGARPMNCSDPSSRWFARRPTRPYAAAVRHRSWLGRDVDQHVGSSTPQRTLTAPL